MSAKFFIAGTDTDVGKTVIACGLLEAANRRGLSTAAIKPIAAGCEQTPEGLRNSDAIALQAAMSLTLPYEQINPVALQPAIAPHLAAQQLGKRLQASRLAGFCQGILMQRADFTLVEGAGGWRVPLNDTEMLSELPRQLQLPVILVVGMRLGCINHAVLTAEAVSRDGLPLAGWVANRVDAAMPFYEENLATLSSLLAGPCLGSVPYLADTAAKSVADHLNIDALMIGRFL